MKKTISLLLIAALLSSCASQPYPPYYGDRYYSQPVYRGYNDGYRSQTTYADSDADSSESSDSSNAGLWVLGGIAAAAILLGGGSDSSSADSTSSWSDGQEAAYQREENARAAAQGNPAPYPGE